MSTIEPVKVRNRKREPLSAERIVDAAIAVIDADGLEGFTMRNLGRELGVDAMAVYGYFDNKAALLDAVVEHEAQRLQSLPGPFPSDPIELLVFFGQHYRRVILEHPNLAPLVGNRPLPQQDVPEIMSLGVRLLRMVGIDDDDIPVIADAMIRYVLGFIVHEAGQAKRRAMTGVDMREQQERLLGELEAMPDDMSLETTMVMRRLREDATGEEFEIGLRAMLHGVRLGLGRPPIDLSD